MKTAKIVEIWKFRKWEWPHGDVFYIPLTLDNGENITLGKKKQDAFKVWDTVCYEENWEWKRKEVKENTFKPKQTFNSFETNKSATIWMAMKIAFDKLYDKTNYNETIQLATRIFEDAMAIYENYWKSESKEEWEDNEQLPF